MHSIVPQRLRQLQLELATSSERCRAAHCGSTIIDGKLGPLILCPSSTVFPAHQGEALHVCVVLYRRIVRTQLLVSASVVLAV
mmetsp:Transcript_50997/g.121149  ORF Transcript_50997/g.121149 Transcript_50997/m.121149 type:complete len:83 (-) Transcript_50997:22-270(-)